MGSKGKKRVFYAHRVENATGKGVWQDLTDNWSGSPFQKDNIEASIDKANHVIKNVCVFGTAVSKNGYTYQDKAIEALAGFTPGAKFFINHPSQTEIQERDGVRDIRHWAGVFFNSRKENDKVYADLKIRPTYFDLVYDVATMQPSGIGNSINARVKVFQNEKGEESIVDMDHLKSIDLVSSAATTTTLFESIKDTRDIQKNDFDKFIEEGLLLDRMKEKQINRAINDLTWEAGDVIGDILRSDDKDMATKKFEINAVVDDLTTQITNITNLLSNTSEKNKNNLTNMEDEDMDFKTLTLDQLATEAPHIIDAIKASLEDVNKREEITLENAALKATNADLTAKMEEINAKMEEINAKYEALVVTSKELETKLDEYETKSKSEAKRALIDAKIKESKLATEAVSDVFISDLMKKDEDDIVASIEDRKELWSKGSGKVKNVGDQKGQPANTGKGTVDVEEATANFLKNFK
jgi:hypothetical protein